MGWRLAWATAIAIFLTEVTIGVTALGEDDCKNNQSDSLQGTVTMTLQRGRKPKDIDLDAEYNQHVSRLHSQIGQPVPLSCSYTRGQRAILVSIEGETASIRFQNGAELTKVPLRDLVNDSGYWK